MEIRTRSLRSIIFKLRSNIIHSSDLLKETSLLSSLLEWFNFDEWALESQVLSLLSELSQVRKINLSWSEICDTTETCRAAQHEKAVQTLVDLGGVEFLSQLRMHSDPSLHSLVDEALENIMMIPSDLVGLTPQSSTSSSSQLTTDATSDVGSYATPTCKAMVDLAENRARDVGISIPPPQQHLEWTEPKELVASVPLQPPRGAPSEAAMMRPCLVGTDAHYGTSVVSHDSGVPPRVVSHDSGVPPRVVSHDSGVPPRVVSHDSGVPPRVVSHDSPSPQQGNTSQTDLDGGGEGDDGCGGGGCNDGCGGGEGDDGCGGGEGDYGCGGGEGDDGCGGGGMWSR